MIVDQPKNKFVITTIWAYLSVDEDGTEGVIAFTAPNGMMMPMIAADQDRLDQLTPIAKDLAKKTGRKIRLCKFTNKEVIKEI